MNLISDDYKNLNVLMHAQNKGYGDGRPDKWKDKAFDLIKKYNAKSFLDYGCGKGNLVKELERSTNINIQGYDPCVYEFSRWPNKVDVVFCVDVLEHIEEDKIIEVLNHISSLTKKVFFGLITLTPSNKTLPDGRNTHILIKPKEYWIRVINDVFFDCKVNITDDKKHVKCLVEK